MPRQLAKRLFLFFVMVCLLPLGCAGTQRVNERTVSDKDLVWPPPPQKARIRYVKTIDTPSSITIRKEKGWFGRLVDFITGGEGVGGFSIDAPYGLYYDDTLDVLYIADRTVQGVHRYDLRVGEASLLALTGEQSLQMPVMVAGGEERLFVSDSVLGKVFIFDGKGRFIKEIGRWGRPGGLAYNNLKERLYVVDVINNRVSAFDNVGNFQFAFGHVGMNSGEFNLPSNIWVDREGKIYITDSMNFRIQIFDEFGNHVRNVGKLGDAPGSFARPTGVAVDSDGNIYVADAKFDNIQIFNQNGELLLYFGKTGDRSGEFTLPSGIYIDINDRIYIADSYNRRIQVFQYVKE